MSSLSLGNADELDSFYVGFLIQLWLCFCAYFAYILNTAFWSLLQYAELLSIVFSFINQIASLYN